MTAPAWAWAGTAFTALQVNSVISYGIAVVIPALDAVFPVLPSETAIIALGVATAGSADPRIALLVACAAIGAFLGDNLSYLIGARFGPRVERRFFRSGKGARRRAWAERSLERFGMQLIVVCRFIPGGRTAVTLCCGIIGYSRRRFVIATAGAGLIWAVYSFSIGRLGGRAFEDRPWAGFLVAFGATIAVSGLIEVIRRIRAILARNRRTGRRADTECRQDGPGVPPRLVRPQDLAPALARGKDKPGPDPAPGRARWLPAVTAMMAGRAVAAQPVADRGQAGSEDQPWSQDQQIDHGHLRLPRAC